MHPRCCRQATSWVYYTTSCKHSLVLLKMGEIIARNMLSWLKLLINRYCCIYLVVYITCENEYSRFITGCEFISSALTFLVLFRSVNVGNGWCQRSQTSRVGSISSSQYTQSLKINENSAPWHSGIKSICTMSISLCKVQLCNMTSIQLYVHPMLVTSVAGFTAPSTKGEESCS